MSLTVSLNRVMVVMPLGCFLDCHNDQELHWHSVGKDTRMPDILQHTIPLSPAQLRND